MPPRPTHPRIEQNLENGTMDPSEREEARKDYNAAMTGFALAMGWLTIVTVISYLIAKMM